MEVEKEKKVDVTWWRIGSDSNDEGGGGDMTVVVAVESWRL